MAPQENPLAFTAIQIVSAGVGSVVGKTIDAPLERLKLLLQNQNEIRLLGRLDEPYKGVVDCTRRIYRTEGVLSFWRGLSPLIIGGFTKTAVQFTLHNSIKKLFRPSRGDNYTIILMKNVSAGSAAGLTTAIAVYPFDYCRIRMANDVKFGQNAERQFRGMIDVYKKTLASDGIAGLYRGFVVYCVGKFLYGGLYFGLYDTLKSILLTKDSGLLSSFALGYGVSLSASLMIYPTDTVRCRMMMRSIEPVKYKGSIQCLIQIVKNEGLRSLWRGAGVTIARSVFGTVLLLGYDSLKRK